jgi:hypothetical protein
MLFGEFVQAGVQLVVPVGQLAVRIVALEQDCFYFLRFSCAHGRPSFVMRRSEFAVLGKN